MHFGIVGCGISGLYLAYRLLQQDHNVTIFEKDSRMGGRLYTVHKENYSLDLGGGRFSTNHKVFCKLVKELQLEFKTMPKTKTIYFKNQTKTKLNVSELLEDIITKAVKEYTKTELKSFTFEFIVRKYYPIEADDIIYGFGYDGPFHFSNAWHTIHQFQNDFSGDFQVLNGGMISLINALYDKVISNGGIVLTNLEITKYDGLSTIIDKNEKAHSFDKICFCLPKEPLLNIVAKYDSKLTKTLDSIYPCQMLRIYTKDSVLDNSNKSISRVSRNNWQRQTITIDKENSIYMKVYCDSRWASMWENYIKKDDIHKYIPNTKWILSKYWKEGVHYWKPFPTYWKNKKESSFYIVGESISEYHKCWCEGALTSVNKLLKLLLKDNNFSKKI